MHKNNYKYKYLKFNNLYNFIELLIEIKRRFSIL